MSVLQKEEGLLSVNKLPKLSEILLEISNRCRNYDLEYWNLIAANRVQLIKLLCDQIMLKKKKKITTLLQH